MIENSNKTTKTIIELNNEILKQKEQTYNAEANASEKEKENQFLNNQLQHLMQPIKNNASN